jgi:hypothetical protein
MRWADCTPIYLAAVATSTTRVRRHHHLLRALTIHAESKDRSKRGTRCRYVMNPRTGHTEEHRPEQGKIGYILLWVLGVPIPILVLFFLMRGCT